MFENILAGVEKPGRYVGNEGNVRRKSFAEAQVRFALAFPDVYEVGLSHLGLRLLYHQLNGLDGVMADRVYAPWFDFEQQLRNSGEPLRALESGRPLDQFDFVGFSLQYELSYSNILTMLDLGRIPLRARDRIPGKHPWLIAGGPCAFHAEPLAEFFDFMVIGEAERVLIELIDLFRRWQGFDKTNSRPSRREFLEELRHVPGIYVPEFFRVSYQHSGPVAAIEPLYPDYTQVGKRLIMDLDGNSPIPEKPLVPLLDIIHNRLGVEIARGCTRGCRFCQAGYIYRPVRERDPAAVLQATQTAVAQSGFEELSLLSLSTGDYCQIQPLLTALMDRLARQKVAVSFPSLRVGTLTPEMMAAVRRVRKTGFTLAPEAGSERLRRVINKDIRDEDLLAAAQTAFQLGWRLLKLYFMMGLPTETDADLDALVDLSKRVWRLAKAARASLNVSVSTFVPKPHTPFQWAPQLSREAVEERLEYLRRKFNRPGLRLKWHHPGHSLLEAVFARGDRRLGDVLLRAWELGARFDGWTEKFREDIWQQAFADCGLDSAFYAQRERDHAEVLPWDHLSAGVEKAFLRHEYEKALSQEFTADCRWNACSNCGVCDHKNIHPVTYGADCADWAPPAEQAEIDVAEKDQQLLWLRYSKLGSMRFFGQLEVAQAFARAIRRSRLPVSYSQGFHPHVKLSFGQALPLGLESLVEEAYLTLTQKTEAASIMAQLNASLPLGLRIEEARTVARRIKAPDCVVVTYRVSNLRRWGLHSIVQNWPKQLDKPLMKKTKKGEVIAPLRQVLAGVRQINETSIEMDLVERPTQCFRPTMILELLLGESTEHLPSCRMCKIAVSAFAGLEESQDVSRAHHQCQLL